MKVIAAFALLALAYAESEVPQVQSIVLPEAPKPIAASPYAERIQIAPPFKAESLTDDDSVVKFVESKSFDKIPAANPVDLQVPILRTIEVFDTPVVANTIDENAAPQYQSPIDMGMIYVPEEVMRAIAAADAMNAEPVPSFSALMPENVLPFAGSEDNLAIKFVDSPVEQILRVAPSKLDAVRIFDAPEETFQVLPMEIPEPIMPFVESEDNLAVKFVDSPTEQGQVLGVSPLEFEAVRIAEAPEETGQDLPVEMPAPVMPFVESEDNFAVKFVDSPMEIEQVLVVAPLEQEAVISDVPVEQPKEFVNIAEMLSLLQNDNRPYPVYNNPMMR